MSVKEKDGVLAHAVWCIEGVGVEPRLVIAVAMKDYDACPRYGKVHH